MTKNDNIAQPRAEREAGRLEAAGPSDRTPSPGLSSSSISTVDRPIPANPTRLQSVKELSSLDSFSPFFTFHVPVPYTQPIRFADLSQPFPPAPQPQQRVESPPPAYSERSIGKRERDTSSPQPPPGVNIDADAEPKAKAAKTKATSTRERAPQPIEVAKKKGKTNVPARLPDELLNSFSSAVKYVRKIPILPAFPLPPLPVISDPRVAEEAFRRDAMMGKRNHDMLAMIGDGLAELYMREYAYGFTPQIENGLTTRINSDIARNTTWAQLSIRYKLPDRLVCFVPGEKAILSQRPKVQADLFEAYIGAVYMSYPIETRDTVATPILRGYFKALLDQLYPMFHDIHRYRSRRYNARRSRYLSGVAGEGEEGSEEGAVASGSRGVGARTRIGTPPYGEESEVDEYLEGDDGLSSILDEDEEAMEDEDEDGYSINEDDEWHEIIGTNLVSLE